MSALKKCDPELRNYLMKHRLPDVFEALLTGLAVNCPDDAKAFIIEKLKEMMANGEILERLRWDSFIEKDHRPTRKVIKAGMLDFLWAYEDENSQPSPEMYQKAYFIYNTKLKVTCFNAWMRYHVYMKRKREILARRLEDARRYYRHRKMRVHLHKWMEWVAEEKRKQNIFSAAIMKVVSVSVMRLVFNAWRNVAVDAKRTREYFERIERGEIIDSEFEGIFRIRSDGMDEISSLPRKIALLIFSFVDIDDLARCSRVCRSWKIMTQSSVLWSKIDFSKLRHLTTNKMCSNLIHKCRTFLCHVNLRGCLYLQKDSLKIVGECRNLQDLNLAECAGVTDDVVRAIVTGCNSLLYLNLSKTTISDSTLRALSRYCNNMLYLSLAHCRNFSNKGLSYIAHGKGCHKIIYLDVSGCEQITHEGYNYLATGCPSLSTIILDELPVLNDECIEKLFVGCHHIKSISLIGSPFLSDAAFKYMAQNARRLSKIKVEGNNRITDATVKALAKHCSDLKHVYLVDCSRLTDLSLRALSQCKHLLVANVADCVRFQDTGVRQVIEGPSGAKLREINLTNCVRVSDVTLLRIAQRCQQLTYASFCYCEHVTDAGVELLGSLPSLTSLDLSGCNISDQGISSLGNNHRFKDINISECRGLGDLGLQKLCQQCRDLENLDISHCSKLTDNAIKNLAFCCRILRTLNLAGCKLLTDSSLQYLSGVCHYLEHLDVSGCTLITDKSIRYLRKGCKQLKALIILYCKNITKQAFQKMQAKCKYVLYSTDEPLGFPDY